jgi:hypothetical protein
MLHNLPPFKKKDKSGAAAIVFPGADVAGIWSKSPGTLKQLADSMEVGEVAFADRDEPIRAIPDPWAQPRTFAEAVLNVEHTLEAEFVPQWRGLLALIGLRGIFAQKYTLTLESFEFGDSLLFDKVLRQLTPRVALDGGIELWNRPVVVRLNKGRAPGPYIAILNPACLVSAARLSANALRACRGVVPWIGETIGDPTRLPDAEKLPKPTLAALRSYLEGVADRLRGLDPGPARDALLGRLEDYVRDVSADIVGIAPPSSYMPEENDLVPALLAPVWGRAELRRTDDPGASSEGRLKLRDVDLGLLKGIILADVAIARAEGRQGHSVSIWGHWMLNQLIGPENEETFRQVRAEAAAQGYLLVKADDLFAERAAHLSTAKLQRHSGGLEGMLLPIKPLALLLHGDLASRMSIQDAGDGSVVKLRLDRIVDERSTAPLELSRTYRYTPQKGGYELLKDRVSLLAETTIWPDFRHPKWRHYYARFAFDPKDNSVQPTVALSAEIVAASLRAQGNGTGAAGVVDGLDRINRGTVEPNGDWLQWFESNLPETNRVEKVEFSNLGFEAVFYNANRQGGDLMVGCAALPLRSVSPDGTGGVVAVDFGTTSTVACFGDREPITFQARLIHPIEIQGADPKREIRRERWKLQEFLPALGQKMPIPSVALLRPGVDRRTAVQPATRHVEFFSYEDIGGTQADGVSVEATLAQYRQVMPRSRFNLKWDHSTDVIQASSDYLRQLLMMIAAEATDAGFDPATLRWRFSKPNSLEPALETRFRENVAPMIDRLSTGVDGKKRGGMDKFVPEGLAAAKYMLANQDGGAGKRPGSINVVLDIGGGTTDISIWSMTFKELWNGSFADMAGKLFFTRTLINNPDLMTEIGLGEFVDIMKLADEPGATARMKQDRTELAELLFSAPKLDAQLTDPNIWNEVVSAEPGLILRASALTFLGGIAYYVGLVVKELVKSGVVKEADLQTPVFALCGRGSGFFRQAHGEDSAEDAESPVAHALSAFSHAAGAAGARLPRVILSPAAKLEVVRGMHIGQSNMKESPHRTQLLPAGVRVSFDSGDVIDESADMRTAQAAANGDPLAPDPVLIRDLIDFLRTTCRIDIDPAPGPKGAAGPRSDADNAYGTISEAIQKRIQAQGGDDEPPLIEPAFISGLRALVTELGNPAAKREKRISVKSRRA